MDDVQSPGVVVRFEAKCKRCGSVPVPPDAVELLHGGEGTDVYRFRCPRCGANSHVEAEPETAELLQALGSAVLVRQSGVESIPEIPAHHPG